MPLHRTPPHIRPSPEFIHAAVVTTLGVTPELIISSKRSPLPVAARQILVLTCCELGIRTGEIANLALRDKRDPRWVYQVIKHAKQRAAKGAEYNGRTLEKWCDTVLQEASARFAEAQPEHDPGALERWVKDERRRLQTRRESA